MEVGDEDEISLVEDLTSVVEETFVSSPFSSAHSAEIPPASKPFFPHVESADDVPMVEASAPDLERSDVIRLTAIVGSLEQAGFAFPGIEKEPPQDIKDLEEVLLNAHWIADEARMRAVIIRTLLLLNQRDYKHKRLKLMEDSIADLGKQFLDQLNKSKKRSLQARLVSSRDKLRSGT